jgi:hypothetical protein
MLIPYSTFPTNSLEPLFGHELYTGMQVCHLYITNTHTYENNTRQPVLNTFYPEFCLLAISYLPTSYVIFLHI